MQCPRCQQDNSSHAKFCLECGARLQRFSGGAEPAPSYEEIQRSLTEALEQQTATAEILRVISSSPTDVQPVFSTIVENAARLCDARFTALFRFDGGLITVAVQHGSTPEELAVTQAVFPAPATRGTAAGRANLERGVVHIHDIRTDSEYGARAALEALGYRTALAVPLLRHGNPIGVLLNWRREVSPFTDGQIELVKTFADQAVIAIENARLFKELEGKNRALSESLEQQTATSEVLQVISQSPTDVQPTFEAIAASAAKLCEAEDSGVFRFEAGLIHLVAHYDPSGTRADVIRQMFPMPPGRASVTARGNTDPGGRPHPGHRRRPRIRTKRCGQGGLSQRPVSPDASQRSTGRGHYG